MGGTSLFLFRNDLRLNDNEALTAACNSGKPVMLLYVLDESPGSASRWWLHHSLEALSNDINKLGGSLLLRKGNTVDILQEVIHEANIDQLYFSRMYEPCQRDIEEQIYTRWHKKLEINRYGGYLLFEPEQIRTGNNQPYKVFTPFWKACLKNMEPKLPKTGIEKKIRFSDCKIRSERLADWRLLPTKPDWAEGLRANWQPGERGAKNALRKFIKTAIASYDEDRHRPDKNGTSRLSPYLHFGEIAPARIWHEVTGFIEKNTEGRPGGMAYFRELGWREFSNHLLFHWPDLGESPFKKEFRDFPWRKNTKALHTWQKGQTGIPIVDAGMRELWHTGWMHNRVRMIVASFLVKHLLIHWREGEAWFWDTLVDADLANNVAGWQWIAGAGADAAPYFRVFNPVLQGKRFDPNGDYVRRWLPEITKLPAKDIHEPWNVSKKVLETAGLEPGMAYPVPIIGLEGGRKRALDTYKKFKNSSG